jgi:CheY-like chemotaxis protein
VKTLTELHGGEVQARSAGPGEGATLVVTLPILEHPIVARTRTPLATTPRSILVIEDDRDVAEWLALALGISGHRVEIASDGLTGITKARELAPDVILCDIGLPGALDGYAVARRLQHDATHATLIALSGYSQPEDQARARDAGFEAHFSKPPDLDALERLLAKLPKRAH